MPTKYPFVIRVIHWTMSAMIISLICVGLWMTSLADDYPGKWDYYALHKSFGITAFLLILTRILVRFYVSLPAFPESINIWERRLAAVVHLLQYAVIFLMPISGYLMSSFGGYDVGFFGIKVPLLFDKNEELAKLFALSHEVMAYSLIVLIGLHVAGIFKHLIVEKTNLFKRMV